MNYRIFHHHLELIKVLEKSRQEPPDHRIIEAIRIGIPARYIGHEPFQILPLQRILRPLQNPFYPNQLKEAVIEENPHCEGNYKNGEKDCLLPRRHSWHGKIYHESEGLDNP